MLDNSKYVCIPYCLYHQVQTFKKNYPKLGNKASIMMCLFKVILDRPSSKKPAWGII